VCVCVCVGVKGACMRARVRVAEGRAETRMRTTPFRKSARCSFCSPVGEGLLMGAEGTAPWPSATEAREGGSPEGAQGVKGHSV